MDTFTAEVLAIAQGGMGVLRPDNRVVFVPGVIPGEEIEAKITESKKTFAQGHLLRIKSISPERIEPKCKHYSVCGGCNFQHMSYQAQVLAKKKLVSDALERIAKIPHPPILMSEAENIWGYRRHIRLKLWADVHGFRLGFIGEDGHVPIKRCEIFSDQNILLELGQIVKNISSAHIKDARVTILKDGLKAVLFFEFFPYMPKNVRDILSKALASNSSFSGAILKDSLTEVALGQIKVPIKVMGLTFWCSPDAFVQNNAEQSERIYLDLLAQVAELKPKTPLLDLYSGIGITSILLARAGLKVTGVEISPKAIALAKKNALENRVSIDWVELSAEDAIDEVLANKQVVIMNPPRTGAKPAVISALITRKPEHIFYISCMPPTLARDLKGLFASGYQIHSIKGYDMFPHTTHVETLVHLIRV